MLQATIPPAYGASHGASQSADGIISIPTRQIAPISIPNGMMIAAP